MAVPKRELGRTKLQVTTLGYGAMELRGAPRARDITEARAETRQPVSVDPRRTTADSMVVRVVASHLVVRLTRASKGLGHAGKAKLAQLVEHWMGKQLPSPQW